LSSVLSDATGSAGWRRPRHYKPSPEFAAKRQKIVSAAAEVFREKGYAKGSLDDVAAVLGIRKPSLYHYVSSKQHLLQLVFHQALNEGLKRMRLLEEIEDPGERLARLIRLQVEVVASDRDHFTVFFDQFSNQESTTVKGDRGDIAHQVRELEREYFSCFVSTVRAATEAGVIPDIDPTYGAQAIIGMTSWIYKWFEPVRHDTEAVIDTYTRLILPRGNEIAHISPG
jgi:AcrR family transcriptional regulator